MTVATGTTKSDPCTQMSDKKFIVQTTRTEDVLVVDDGSHMPTPFGPTSVGGIREAGVQA